MTSRLATYTHYEKTPADIVAEFSALGFNFSAPEQITHTLLDTFDGRLHEAGLQLSFHNGTHSALTLTGEKSVPLALSINEAPRFWHELPPGPLRDQIGKLADIRALLPQATLSTHETRATWQNANRNIVATATLYQDLKIPGCEKLELPSWLIEIETSDEFTAYTNEILALVGRTKLGRLHESVLAICIRAANIKLEGFASKAAIPLDPKADAIDGFRDVLANLCEAITANWQGTIDQIDPEFLHELRVAIRRTRAILRQGKNVLPPAMTEHARAHFAWLGAITGAARDFDVFLLEWEDYTANLDQDVIAALKPTHSFIEQKRRDAYAELVPKLQSREATEFIALWRTWLHDPLGKDPHNHNPRQQLGKIVAKRIARTQSRLIKKGRLITPETPCEQVHELRKDAKKVRYLFECFGDLFPKNKQRNFVRRLKSFQDILGEHQDAAIHVAELRVLAHELHAKNVPVDTMLATGQLIEQLDQRRKAAREAFAKGFTSYDSKENRQTLEKMLGEIP